MSIETGIGSAPISPSGAALSPVYTLRLTMMDAEGEVSTQKLNLVSNGGAGAILVNDLFDTATAFATAYANLSNAQVTSLSIAVNGYVSALKPAEPSGNLDNIEDKAFIEYQTAFGRRVQTQVPVPDPSVFLADGETVNPGSAVVSGFSTMALTGHVDPSSNTWLLSTEQGDPAKVYTKGYLRRAKTRRRLRQGISTEIGG